MVEEKLDELSAHLHAVPCRCSALPEPDQGGLVVTAGGCSIAATHLEARQLQIRLRIFGLLVPQFQQQLPGLVILMRGNQSTRERQTISQVARILGDARRSAEHGRVQIALLKGRFALRVPRASILYAAERSLEAANLRVTRNAATVTTTRTARITISRWTKR